MRKWMCIKVEHHGNVAEVIENYEAKGWRLYTYQTAGMGGAMNYTVNHHLLFEKGERARISSFFAFLVLCGTNF